MSKSLKQREKQLIKRLAKTTLSHGVRRRLKLALKRTRLAIEYRAK